MYLLSPAGLDRIKRYEELRLVAYLCPAGIPTIGYGSIRGVVLGMTITEAEADRMLAADVAIAERSVMRLIKRELTQNQYDALVSFTFNLGGGALQRSTLRQKINRGDDAGAVEEFKKWVYAGGKKLKGLVRRREEEALCYAGRIVERVEQPVVASPPIPKPKPLHIGAISRTISSATSGRLRR